MSAHALLDEICRGFFSIAEEVIGGSRMSALSPDDRIAETLDGRTENWVDASLR